MQTPRTPAAHAPPSRADGWLDEREQQPGGEGAAKYVVGNGAGLAAVSVDSDSMWSQLSLYGLLQGMPLAQATCLKDQGRAIQGINNRARRGEEVHVFMDEIRKDTARKYIEQVCHNLRRGLHGCIRQRRRAPRAQSSDDFD